MQNGAFEKRIQEIDAKLFREGLDSVSDRDLQLLMLNSQNKLGDKIDRLGRPFWKLWTYRELATAFTVVLAMLGLVNWDKVASLLTTIASAAGTR